MLAKSRKHRKSEFGEWKKASRVELGVRKTGMRGKLRRRGGTWGSGIRSGEEHMCVVCVCLCVYVCTTFGRVVPGRGGIY